ncbi:hypothetical protein [Rickettsiales endosymbiont of Stachyamoeba lipophora]|nr:hypothetical protein [Rickettsiales endosymbiont of Stachyamoeba lipophora]
MKRVILTLIIMLFGSVAPLPANARISSIKNMDQVLAKTNEIIKYYKS